jgi:hypothetical protein
VKPVNGVRPYFVRRLTNHCDNTRWFKYDRDDLGVNKSQFVPVIFEPPCTSPCLELSTSKEIIQVQYTLHFVNAFK